jgi:2-polyprenyl-3-methyl-5-hydroxy-6-metoxy-1,4-benzoquinol methylase
MRIGLCEQCGYRGYIDRPSAQWFSEFYRHEWDASTRENFLKEIEKAKVERGGVPESITSLLKVYETDSKDKTQPVCDIGCGKGLILSYLRRMGRENLVGIESSETRARLTKEAFGIETLVGNFEDSKVVEVLQKKAPFSLFLSSHVLEHVYEPETFVRTAEALQKDGDYLLLNVPNGFKESVIGTVFWLPHLHTFTEHALEALLNRCGYEVVEYCNDEKLHLAVLSRKVQSPKRKISSRSYSLKEALAHLHSRFLLEGLSDGVYRFSWKSKTFSTWVTPASSSRFLDQLKKMFVLDFSNNSRTNVLSFSRHSKGITQTPSRLVIAVAR